jgi:hypothetical protein
MVAQKIDVVNNSLVALCKQWLTFALFFNLVKDFC